MEITELDDLHTNVQDHEDIDNSELQDNNQITDNNDTTLLEEKNSNKDYNLNDYKKSSDETDETDETVENSQQDIKKKEEKEINTENLSGIEQYLAQFNIEGGMIDFEDGSRIHFNELDAAKQLNVLSKLHSSITQDIESKFGLDEDEIGLINYMRQQEGTIDEIINRLAQQRAQTYITSQEVLNTNVKDMDADAIYTAFLLKSNPTATVEQLEEDLTVAKKMSNFDNIVSNLKAGMLRDQEIKISQQSQANSQALYDEIETQRKQVVDTVSKLDSIDGLSINDGIKNDVLDLILNVDDDGDSLFMTEVFSDPNKLFKAAFWYKNGADIISSREEYWKKEKSAAYKRGQTDAQTGKKSFSSTDVNDKNKTTPHYNEPQETVSFDDLY